MARWYRDRSTLALVRATVRPAVGALRGNWLVEGHILHTLPDGSQRTEEPRFYYDRSAYTPQEAEDRFWRFKLGQLDAPAFEPLSQEEYEGALRDILAARAGVPPR